MADSLAQIATDAVDSSAELLDRIQGDIWTHPELRFEEKKAHDLLTEELRKAGFDVTPSFVLPTAFKAEFNSFKASGTGPTVCFVAEYDALPDLGHACGHNLIAEAGFGAALALKRVLEISAHLSGRVVCMGTPAEEGGAGKALMMKGGAFTDVDVVLMVHPSALNDIAPPFLAVGKVRVRFQGKASHAAGFPWAGVNALDAAVSAYSSISVLRQQMKPSWKIHGVITKGGSAANVIPDDTELYYYYRAPDNAELEQVRRRMEACFQGAALATGCTVDLDWQGGYEALLTNGPLADVFREHAQALGASFSDRQKSSRMVFMASSDIGHVSQRIPTIQPTFEICAAPNHSREFASAAGSREAQAATLIMTKALALTGLDVIRNPELLQEAVKHFRDKTSAV